MVMLDGVHSSICGVLYFFATGLLDWKDSSTLLREFGAGLAEKTTLKKWKKVFERHLGFQRDSGMVDATAAPFEVAQRR